MSYRTSITITNTTEYPITFHLEPWGEQLAMLPKTAFQVVAEAKEIGELEVEFSQTDIVVWAWTGSTVTVWCDGNEVGGVPGRRRPTVPATPKGMKVSSFLGLIEGRKK